MLLGTLGASFLGNMFTGKGYFDSFKLKMFLKILEYSMLIKT